MATSSANLSTAVDEYRRTIRQQELVEAENTTASSLLEEQISKTLANVIVGESTVLSTTDDYEKRFAPNASSALVPDSTASDPADGEDMFIRGIVQSAMDSGVRLLTASSIGTAIGGLVDIIALTQDRLAAFKKLVEDLDSNFDNHDRTAFDTVAADSVASIPIKVALLKADIVSALAAAQASRSWIGVRPQLERICAALEDIADQILTPSGALNIVYALIQRFEVEILDLIDFLLEVIDIVDNILAIRNAVPSVGPPYEVMRGYAKLLEQVSEEYENAVDDLKDTPKYRRVEVVRDFALQLKTIGATFCRGLLNQTQAMEFSVFGHLLLAIETALNPLKAQLQIEFDKLKGNAPTWLRTMRTHVQVDLGVGFDNTVTNILGTMDLLINIVLAIQAAVEITLPGGEGQELLDNSTEAMDQAGQGRTSAGFSKGKVSTSREQDLAVGTAAGNLSACLRLRMSDLRTQGKLTLAIRRDLEEILAYLDSQNAGALQSAAVQRSRTSEAINAVEDQREQTDKVVRTLEALESL